ncbi:MAG: TatD family hydrolase [Chthoniobacteraceae bacterium]
MSATLFDAHNHLHDARLLPWRSEFLTELPALGVRRAVVNGTREADWPGVAALATQTPWVLPSFGLHPWYVNERSPAWSEALLKFLDEHPGAGVGEIGLDRWIEGHDPVAQAECFRAQLAIATERNLPATIHCVRAWGALWDIIRECAVPARGFLLHAYGGPAEMVAGFLARDAYFSFSPSFLHERKSAQREIFRVLPEERILVETDAPDLAPPPEKNPRPLTGENGKSLNHPGNLVLAYDALAKIRGVTREEIATVVEKNFARLFPGEKECPPPAVVG